METLIEICLRLLIALLGLAVLMLGCYALLTIPNPTVHDLIGFSASAFFGMVVMFIALLASWRR